MWGDEFKRHVTITLGAGGSGVRGLQPGGRVRRPGAGGGRGGAGRRHSGGKID